jgi:hypothetical protein
MWQYYSNINKIGGGGGSWEFLTQCDPRGGVGAGQSSALLGVAQYLLRQRQTRRHLLAPVVTGRRAAEPDQPGPAYAQAQA